MPEQYTTSQAALTEEQVKKREYDRMLAQELDGQISLSLPDDGTVERQLTGQLHIDEVLKEWESKKQDSANKRKEDAKRKALDQTNDLLSQLVGIVPGIVSPVAEEPHKEEVSEVSGAAASEAATEAVVAEEPEDKEIKDKHSVGEVHHKVTEVTGSVIKTAFDAEDKQRALEVTGKIPDFILPSRKADSMEKEAEKEIEAENEDGIEEIEEINQPEELPELMSAEEYAEPQPEPYMEIPAESQPEPYTEAVPEPQLESDTEVPTEPQPESYMEIPTEPQPEPYTEIPTEPQPELYTEVPTEPQPELYTEVPTELQPEPYMEAPIEVVEETPLEAPISEAETEQEAEESEEPKTEHKKGRKELPSYMTLDGGPKSKRDFNEEERRIFASFDGIEVVKAQIVDVMEEISMEGNIGNVVLMGSLESGRAGLAIDIVRAMQIIDTRFSGKVAKITGKALNKKDIPITLGKLSGGALVIEEAGDITRENMQIITNTLQSDIENIVVVLEDTKAKLQPLLDKTKAMKKVFNAVIDIPEYSNDDLVSYAKGYAKGMEYAIDEMGVLALYTRIGELQTLDHIVSLEEVKEIVDGAIRHVDKKNMTHFMDVLFAKRYDDEDYIILREKDFITKK